MNCFVWSKAKSLAPTPRPPGRQAPSRYRLHLTQRIARFEPVDRLDDARLEPFGPILGLGQQLGNARNTGLLGRCPQEAARNSICTSLSRTRPDLG